MNEMERELATMMKQRAENVVSPRGAGPPTLRRARRRRMATATTGAALVLVVVGGGVGAVRALDSDRPSRAAEQPATAPPGGEFGFSSTPGEYPYIATGRFRGGPWELRGAAVSLEHDAAVRLTVNTGNRAFQSRAYASGDEPLFVRYQPWVWVPGRDVALVFGAATPEVETVEVVLEGHGEPIRAQMFNGYDDRSTITVDYFMAFIPPEATGEVIARDAGGDVVARDVISREEVEGQSY